MVKIERQNKKINTRLYNQEVKKLRKLIDKNIPIDHVGSTAIPNMVGKNIIDILIGISSDKEMDKITNILIDLGYFPGKKCAGYEYRFFASKKEETSSGDIHIHLANINTDRYKDFLILKNYLLKNKEERKNYSNIKKQILKECHNEREEYKIIKSKYVTDLLERAKNNKNI